MSRHATCRQCGNDFITPSDVGRLPTKCPDCGPSYTARYRTEILQLRAEVARLKFDQVFEFVQ